MSSIRGRVLFELWESERSRRVRGGVVAVDHVVRVFRGESVHGKWIGFVVT